MESWVYVVGVIVILFLISQKGILGSRNRVDDGTLEDKSKLEGKGMFYGWLGKR